MSLLTYNRSAFSDASANFLNLRLKPLLLEACFLESGIDTAVPLLSILVGVSDSPAIFVFSRYCHARNMKYGKEVQIVREIG